LVQVYQLHHDCHHRLAMFLASGAQMKTDSLEICPFPANKDLQTICGVSGCVSYSRPMTG
jgi:hypothetical protein